MNRFFLLLPMLCVAVSCRHVSESTQTVFDDGAIPRMLLAKGAGEGPAWHPEWGLLFSGGGNITRFDRDGNVRMFRPDAGSNGLLFDAEGRLLTCEPVQRRVTRTDLDGRLTVLTEEYEGQRYNQPNDITVDSRGRIYFSDPKYGSRETMVMIDESGRKIEGVYRIDLDGSVTRIINHEVDRPNGVLVSLDDRFLYVADNNNNTVGGARKLWRFGLRIDGNLDLESQTLIFDWETGRGPDGMVQDTNGTLYVAGGLNEPNLPFETADKFKGGVYVFNVKGEFLEHVTIPRDEVTNCTFGDDDLKTLYITGGGTLWSIRTKTAGWLPWPKIE